MYKRLFLITLSCALLFSCATTTQTTEKQRSDRDELLLSGNVKQVTTKSYTTYNPAEPSDTTLRFVSHNVTIFNEDGNFIENSFYDSLGNQTSSLKREYNDKGMLTATRSSIDGVTDDAATTYLYDKRGNLTDQIDYRKGVEIYRVTYSYDSEGRETLRAILGTETEIDYEYGTIYDEGLKVKETFYNKLSGERSSTHFTYDDSGELTLSEEIYAMSPLSNTATTYDYDTRGNLTEKIAYSLDTGLDTSHDNYVYDKYNNVIAHSARERGLLYLRDEVDYDSLSRPLNIYNYDIAPNGKSTLTDITFYRYTEEGLRTAWGSAEPDGKILEMWEATFEKDPQGNYTKMTTTHSTDEDFLAIETREIIYY